MNNIKRRLIGAEHFETDGDDVRLRVSRCRSCGAGWFPARAQCSTCASLDLAAELSSNAGIAHAASVVRVGPPGFPTPYVLAYNDVDGIRVLAHVASATGAPAPDTPVRLVVAPIAADTEGPLFSYAVTPDGATR